MDLLTIVDDWKCVCVSVRGGVERWQAGWKSRSDMRREWQIATQAQVNSGWDLFYLPVHVEGGNSPTGVWKHASSFCSYCCVFCCFCIVCLCLQSCDPKGNCLSAYNKGLPCDYRLHFSELIVRNNAHFWRIKLADVDIFLSSSGKWKIKIPSETLKETLKKCSY